MRQFITALAAVFATSSVFAGGPPDAVVDMYPDLEDARPEIYGRAIDRLIEVADAARVLKMARIEANMPANDDSERIRYAGVAYCIELARRCAATTVGSVERWMTLEELMRSSWKEHATSVLRRAGLSDRDATVVLIERTQAQLACQDCLDKALADDRKQDSAVAEIARRGNAVVPHALGVLAVSPWIASTGWPKGTIVLKQRTAAKILSAMKARVAVPYLLQHVEAPSAMLQFDVLRALTAITGDATWVGSEVSKLETISAQRAAWWKREGTAYADASRWFALDGLRVAADYQFAVVRGGYVNPYEADKGPKPLDRLFSTIELLTGRKAPDADDVPYTRMLDVVNALRHFEGIK